MELTNGVERFLRAVKSGSKETILLTSEDSKAIRTQFGGSYNFLDFIEKESGTVHTYIQEPSLCDDNQKILITFLNGAEIELRMVL